MNIATAIINIKKLKSNIDYLMKNLNNSDLYPVIKANAYGHGLEKIAIILQSYGIKGVCVATINEIEKLLDLRVGYTILHLGKISYSNLSIYENKNLIATINSIEDINQIDELYRGKNPLRAHIKIDTGMSRMGCNINEFEDLFKKCVDSNSIQLEGIYSHLSNSDNDKSEYNIKQINAFNNTINKVDIKSLTIHLLNSGGLFNYNNYSYDMVRVGLAIYGISPLGTPDKHLMPIMEFKAPIVLVKFINKDTMVGYGSEYIANSDMKIGIVQCGYGDGLPLEFSNKGYVYYKNQQIKIIGRVSMDLISIDITNVNCEVSDCVTIWGGDNNNSKLENIALFHNSIPYKYITGLTSRVERKYIDE